MDIMMYIGTLMLFFLFIYTAASTRKSGIRSAPAIICDCTPEMNAGSASTDASSAPSARPCGLDMASDDIMPPRMKLKPIHEAAVARLMPAMFFLFLLASSMHIPIITAMTSFMTRVHGAQFAYPANRSAIIEPTPAANPPLFQPSSSTDMNIMLSPRCI